LIIHIQKPQEIKQGFRLPHPLLTHVFFTKGLSFLWVEFFCHCIAPVGNFKG